jgi:hypothetical protein
VGAAIWSVLEAARTADEIARGLVEEFEVSPEEARSDTARFLDALLEAGMIQVVT